MRCGQQIADATLLLLRHETWIDILMAKVPDDEMHLRPVTLNLDFADTYSGRQWEAYERRLMDVIRGKLTLFMRRDELDAAWRWIEPVLDGWAQDPNTPKSYTAGTWGSVASSNLLGRDGSEWRQDS